MTPRLYDQPEAQSGTELVLAIWRRRKWLALVVFAAAVAIVGSLARWLPDMYRATSTVLIERQQVSEAFVRLSVTAELETRIQTIRQEMMSRTRLTDLITRFDLYPDLRQRQPFDVAIERMRRDIKLDLKGVNQLSGRTETIAFTLSFIGRDPRTVADVANTLASLYVEENTKMRGRQASRTAEVLRAQLEAIKKELDEQERLSSDFKLQHVGELPQQMEANLASLERLNTQLRLNGENQIRAIDRRERIERQLNDEEPGPAGTGSERAPANELAARKRELGELLRNYTEQYPDVIRMRAEVAALERQAAQSPRRESQAITPGDQGSGRLGHGLRDIDAELRTLKDEERALRRAIIGYEQRVENAPKRQQEFQELSRGSQAANERYDALLKRYEEAQLAESLEQGSKVEQFRILDPALPPNEVTAPNRLLLLALGLVLAVGVAVGASVVAEWRDTAFHSVDQLRAFAAVPVLVSIPRIETKSGTRLRRWRLAVATVSVIVCLGLLVEGVHRLAKGNEEIVRLLARS